MCWITDERTTAQVAKEDIPVFKLCTRDMSNNILPYYYSNKLKYEVDLTYTSKIHKFKNAAGQHEINRGIHSYSPKCTISSFSYGVSVISPEFRTLDNYCRYALCMILCVIPEGSTFYLNEKGEYVSNRITVVKAIDWTTDDMEISPNKILNKWIHKKIEI